MHFSKVKASLNKMLPTCTKPASNLLIISKMPQFIHVMVIKNINPWIANLNIGAGLFSKEELLINTIMEQNIDILGVSEVDIENFDNT